MMDIRNVVNDLFTHFKTLGLFIMHLITVHFSKSVTFLWYIFNHMVNTKSCHFSDHNSFINYILDELSKSCICLDTMLLFFFSLSDKYDVHFDN